MGVVETDEPLAVRRVERQRVGDPVRDPPGLLHRLDLELEVMAAWEVVQPPVIAEQQLERVLGDNHAVSYHVMIGS